MLHYHNKTSGGILVHSVDAKTLTCRVLTTSGTRNPPPEYMKGLKMDIRSIADVRKVRAHASKLVLLLAKNARKDINYLPYLDKITKAIGGVDRSMKQIVDRIGQKASPAELDHLANDLTEKANVLVEAIGKARKDI